MSVPFFCRPPVKGGSDPRVRGGSGGFGFSENQPPVRYAHAPLNRGAKR